MVRRLALLLLGLVFAAWIFGIAFVGIFEAIRPRPEAPREVAIDASRAEVAAAWGLRPGGGMFSRGYTSAFSVGVEGFEYSCIVRRGVLDRRSATFPLTVRYAVNGAVPLAAVHLVVAEKDGETMPDDALWHQVGSAIPAAQGEVQVVYFRDVPVPADTCYCGIRPIVTHGECYSFSHSVPTAETWLGRTYDRVAWWPIFRWLPLAD